MLPNVRFARSSKRPSGQTALPLRWEPPQKQPAPAAKHRSDFPLLLARNFGPAMPFRSGRSSSFQRPRICGLATLLGAHMEASGARVASRTSSSTAGLP